MKLRVLHVYKDYAPVIGGIENHLRLLAEGEAARGLDVTVLVTSRTRRTVVEASGGVRVVKAARLIELASTPLSVSLFSWLARLDSDITHLHFPYPPGEIGTLLLRRRSRLVVTYHSDIVRQKALLRLYRGTLRRVLRRADRIIATSPSTVRSSMFLSEVAGRCTVIPHGIERGRFEHADPAAAAQIQARFGRPLLLFVGRLRYYKGLNYLLEAMARIPARLLVIGTGRMEAEWRALAGRLDLGERVVFLGDVPDENLPAYYAACELLVLPASNRSEAFGLVQVESMAAGRPVVSTELSTGTSWVNVHGETGLVVAPRDSDALVRSISALLQDPARRLAMGRAGRVRAEREFSRERMIDRTIELYETLLDRRSASAELVSVGAAR